jgi:hypothetical protein
MIRKPTQIFLIDPGLSEQSSGHDFKVWKDIVSALRMVGYDHAISFEHEGGMMSFDKEVKRISNHK